MMNLNKSILTIIVLAGIFLFMIESINNSFAQVNQTSNNKTAVGNQSSSSSDNLTKTSRMNGSSIVTANEHAKLIKP